jgi:hypothetical protein
MIRCKVLPHKDLWPTRRTLFDVSSYISDTYEADTDTDTDADTGGFYLLDIKCADHASGPG